MTDAGPQSAPDNGSPASALRLAIVEALRTCYDPEIPIDIYELGLIYAIHVDGDGHAQIKMTLTSPMCPAAQSLPPEVKEKVESVDGIVDAAVEIVWEPPWDQSMMSEAARLQLGMY
ncbi:MAG: SUF system Fe-S cluster assembly protein [Acidobacteriota bacterium]